jgi:hypothetical protein
LTFSAEKLPLVFLKQYQHRQTTGIKANWFNFADIILHNIFNSTRINKTSSHYKMAKHLGFAYMKLDIFCRKITPGFSETIPASINHWYQSGDTSSCHRLWHSLLGSQNVEAPKTSKYTKLSI